MLEDSLNEDEKRIIKSTNEKIILIFDNEEARKRFEERIIAMCERSELIEGEGYTCGMCAAYPCFRNPGENDPAGLCFQPIRRCRQECKFYHYDKFPGDGGICRIDKSQVRYEQECHIPEQRTQKKK